MTVARRRNGSTLLEQLAAIIILGILAALTFSSGSKLLDRAAVRSAARETSDAFGSARDHAISFGTRTAVRIGTAGARLVVHSGTDTIARHPLGVHHRVSLEASRDSMAYSPSGLGWGAANMRLVLRRGTSVETLTVSRLGRVRRN